jgi:hypothetical protein
VAGAREQEVGSWLEVGKVTLVARTARALIVVRIEFVSGREELYVAGFCRGARNQIERSLGDQGEGMPRVLEPSGLGNEVIWGASYDFQVCLFCLDCPKIEPINLLVLVRLD